MKEKLWIPDRYFCVWGTKEHQGDLAFITPISNDSAFAKRKETAMHWAKGYYAKEGTPEPKEMEFDNVPVSGLKLVKNVSRWSTSNVVWRIFDPRGFEFELYSGNMNELLQYAGVIAGELQGEYIYGREGSKNALIPVGTELHQQAVENTVSRSSELIPMSEINKGDLVYLRTQGKGMKAIYAGKYYSIRCSTTNDRKEFDPFHSSRSRTDYRHMTYHYGVSKKAEHVFLHGFDKIERIVISAPKITKICEQGFADKNKLNLHKLVNDAGKVRHENPRWPTNMSENRQELYDFLNALQVMFEDGYDTRIH